MDNYGNAGDSVQSIEVTANDVHLSSLSSEFPNGAALLRQTAGRVAVPDGMGEAGNVGWKMLAMSAGAGTARYFHSLADTYHSLPEWS